MRKIVHLVPYDGVGGVETAARTMVRVDEPDLHFEVQYLSAPDGGPARPPRLHPLALGRALGSLLRGGPDLWIASLWRPAMVGIAAKLLLPRRKFVLFLHASRNVHWADAAVTRVAASLADEIWADSRHTLDHRLPSVRAGKGRVIDFLVDHRPALPARSVRPKFVYWGRISAEKQLERALALFAAVYRLVPSARFDLIGPDGGELARMQALAADLGVASAVAFLGRRRFEEILPHAAEASFYLQTSSFEGMGLSVVEAMQLGVVPVVTPVGEIGRYCHDGINAVVVHDEGRAVGEVLSLLGNNEAYQRMRANAIATWSRAGLYRDSMLQACRALLAGASSADAKENAG